MFAGQEREERGTVSNIDILKPIGSMDKASILIIQSGAIAAAGG
jgi:hypothetical protein